MTTPYRIDVHHTATTPWTLQCSRPEKGVLLLSLGASWRMENGLPTIAEFERQLDEPTPTEHVGFDTRQLTGWDSGLLVYLGNIFALCARRDIQVDKTGLPEGVRRLLDLALAVPAKKETGRGGKPPWLVARMGMAAVTQLRGASEMIRFTGETVLAFGRLFRGKAQFRRSDLLLIIQEVGPRALPIVSLISFLVGLILAYMSAVQLGQFGAQIYVAALVGLSMARIMGALMTGIIIAGRTGAAFAAQLGTMQVNEEIDAFTTMGVSPMDFLVLPRMLALIIMMPLLALYADFVGILAGLVVGVAMLDLGTFAYYHETVRTLTITQFAVGLSMAAVYGVLIAFAGCLRGMQCGRSAQAVGEATTSAVVTGIVFITAAAAVLTIVYNALGI
jgi:phospholipid/cholesterol/gamma-HCH transport system permease protein